MSNGSDGFQQRFLGLEANTDLDAKLSALHLRVDNMEEQQQRLMDVMRSQSELIGN